MGAIEDQFDELFDNVKASTGIPSLSVEFDQLLAQTEEKDLGVAAFGVSGPTEVDIEQAFARQESAPAGARLRAGLAPELTEDVARNALSAALDKPVETMIVEGGKIEFIDPDTGEQLPFNAPGLSASDLAALVGPGITLTGEVAGGIAGIPFGRPITGAVLGAAAGETARLAIARGIGVDDDLGLERTLDEVVKSSALAGLGGTVLRAVFAFSKGVMTAALKALPASFEAGTAARLTKEIPEATAPFREISERIGREVSPTSGQAFARTAEGAEIFAVERELAKTPGVVGRTINNMMEGQRQAFREFLDVISREAGVVGDKTGAFKIGARLQNEAHRKLKQIHAKLVKPEIAAREGVEREIKETIIDRAASGNTQAFGLAKRNIFAREQREFQSMEASKYLEIDDMARVLIGDDQVPLGAFTDAIKDGKAILESNLINQLDEFDRGILKSVSDKVLKRQAKIEGLDIKELGGAAGMLKSGFTGKAKFSDVQGTLSALKKMLRQIRSGGTTDVSEGLVRRLIKGLQTSRTQFLQTRSPALLAKIEETEKFVRAGKDNLDRGIIGKLMRESQGAQAVPDEKFFQNIIKPNNPTESNAVADILKSPRGQVDDITAQLYDDAWEGMRSAIRNLYDEKVLVGGVERKGFRAAHNRFIKKFEETIEPFFSKTEMTQIKKLVGVTDVLEQAVARKERLMEFATKTIPAKISRLNKTSAVFRELWRDGDPTSVRQMVNIAGKDEGMQRSIRSAIYNDMKTEFTDEVNERTVFNFSKLGKYLKKHDESLEIVFGKRYVKDLRVLEKALAVAAREPALVQRRTAAQALQHLARAGVGLFTVAGRVMTAGIRMTSRSAEKAIIDSITDPARMRDLIRIASEPLKSQAVSEVFGGLGAYTLLTPIVPE